MSKTQVKKNTQIEGGFLGMLAGIAAKALPFAMKALPAIAKTLGIGALSGLAHTGVQKALGNGQYLKKGGCLSQVESHGEGLYLHPPIKTSSSANGLYYVKQGKMYDGRGLILGPDSPFQNIPILGAIVRLLDHS